MTHTTQFDLTAHPGNRRRGIGVWAIVRPLSGAMCATKAPSPT
ncbi:MAG: hypothetical protein ABIS68_03815 [Casimicrobiaceae bacterium]